MNDTLLPDREARAFSPLRDQDQEHGQRRRNGGEEVTHRSPEDIMDEIAMLDAESAGVLENIRGLV
ncbi:MAG: hypothetical protein HY267_01455 [Deltaproteobacteria bacterium]|nr:hypothetical protein [Deltaproteobacteria bacterium]